MIFLLWLLFLLYLGIVLGIYLGLKQLQKTLLLPPNLIQHTYSLIIAAHNEAANIGAALTILTRQDYPGECYEIIVAADRCSDETAAVVRSFQKTAENLHLIEITQIPQGISPKKNALRQGIRRARFDRLLFLDADVIPSATHIKTFNRYFHPDTAAVVSLVKLSPQQTFWQQFLGFEKLLSWCIAGAGVGFRRPILAYGGNWGYTKNAFEKTGGFQHIQGSLSGDDDLLIQQMGALGLSIHFCLQPEGWIQTEPPGTLAHFLRQRRRHFSAGRKYRFCIQLGYFIYHLSNVLLWWSWLFYWPALIMLLSKLFADTLLIQLGSRIFKTPVSARQMLSFNFMYMLYNTFIGPLGHVGKIKW